ncbi:MAG: TetR/AcrR family transcriptional regulator [Chloroflexi bacterium]|nr:TetR/AcrR family transcriptional regulator [Chloroflexota bacterium]MDA1271213.1 TetR/AcrR family transcriptional regulator [Chloroflexota bacterium]PKB59641.1 MAG: hypothetical protein BZY83_00810 [SAR202 cluster bacterium Casp-Chloro-G2]
MPKVSDAHIEARRQQILEAAQACFARQGFHQTSIQDICREAKLSPGAVYKYFPSKGHIIAASCLGCQEGIADFISGVMSQGSTPLEALDSILEHGLAMLEGEEHREPTMMNIQVWSEAVRSAEVRKALMEVTFNTLGKAFTEIFRQAQERGEVDAHLDPEALGITVMGMFHGLVLHRTLDPQIDTAACGKAMRALYQGTVRTESGVDITAI